MPLPPVMQTCARLPDWEIALAAFARTQCGQPFVWGQTNCVSLAFRALDAMCGSNLQALHWRSMRSQTRALAWVRRHGLAGLVDVLQGAGLVLVPRNFEQPGDVCLVNLPGPTIGASVVLGRLRLSSTSEEGVGLFSPEVLAVPDVILGVR